MIAYYKKSKQITIYANTNIVYIETQKIIATLTEILKYEIYIDSFITGAVLIDEKLVIDDDFNKCQQAFCKIQLLIKRKLENIIDKVR